MANLSEIALGIARVLQSSPEPEPFPLTLIGQSLEGGAFLLKTIVQECCDANVRLHKIEVDPELLRFMSRDVADFTSYLGVSIVNAFDLQGEVRFFRRAE